MIPIADRQHQILSGVAIFYLLKAFANGGASLTGLEAISNGVSAFKRPEGINARKTLTIMSMHARHARARRLLPRLRDARDALHRRHVRP